MTRRTAIVKVDATLFPVACVASIATVRAVERVASATSALVIAGLVSACNIPLEHFARADGGSPGSGDDASSACDHPREICAGLCVDPAESPTNCGRCGHDCGRGACVAGACQPVVIETTDATLGRPTALAVNTTALFWTEQTRLRSCPLPAGCTSAPAVIADGYSALDALAVTENAIYFAGCPACNDHHDLLRCPFTGCPDPPSIIATSSSPYADIVAGNTHVFWREASNALIECADVDCAGTTVRLASSLFGGSVVGVTIAGSTAYVKPAGTSVGFELRTCDETGSCDTRSILTGSYPITPPFRIHGGSAYWLVDGLAGKQLLVCPLLNCHSVFFAAADPDTAEFELDDTAVYWLAPSAGAVRACPLSGCPRAGPITLADGRINPRKLTLGAGFLYWIEGNTIVRLALP